jgi:hypothetical protein
MTVNLRLCPLKNIWGTLVSRVISFFPKTFGHTIIYLPPHKKKMESLATLFMPLCFLRNYKSSFLLLELKKIYIERLKGDFVFSQTHVNTRSLKGVLYFSL